MRKVFLMLGVSLFSLNAEATICTPTPDCVSLGYKYSLEDCEKGAVKCPNGEGYYCPNPVNKCAIGDIYYSDKTCLPADKHDSTKTVLGVVVYITDGGKHGQIMAPLRVSTSGDTNGMGSILIKWSTQTLDISTLPNNTIFYNVIKDYDSCGNTNKIIASGNSTIFPAAWAAKFYHPTPETAGKWCLPAAGILHSWYNNSQIIDATLNKINNTSSSQESIYQHWSSSEYSDKYAHGLCRGDNGLCAFAKTNYLDVRPVLEFQALLFQSLPDLIRQSLKRFSGQARE